MQGVYRVETRFLDFIQPHCFSTVPSNPQVYMDVLEWKSTTLGLQMLAVLGGLRPREHSGYEKDLGVRPIQVPGSATLLSAWRTLGKWLHLFMGQFSYL